MLGVARIHHYIFLCLLFSACDITPQQSSSSTSGGNVVAITDVHEEDGAITGYLENLSSYEGPFRIEFVSRDSSGAKVESPADRTEGLKKGERWKFKAHHYDRDAKSYSFVGVESRYGLVRFTYMTRAETEAEQERVETAARAVRSKREAEEEKIQAKVRADEQQARLEAQEIKAREKREATLERIISFQLQQASNGLPTFQYEIAQRYLTGDGVKTNRALAIQWLKSACTNGSALASNALSKLSED